MCGKTRGIRVRWVTLVLAAMLLAACTGVPRGVEPVTGFDVTRYDGTWYSIMRLDHRFERGLTNVSATYRLRDDGTVDVHNRGFDPDTCRWNAIDGRARFQGSTDTASLSVTFFWPIHGGYHVFALDKDDYQWAAVSGPTRGYLWILARETTLPEDTLDEIIAKAASLDYPVDELIHVEHGGLEACDP